MAINEKIVTGKKLRRFVNGAWERISFWHKAKDCEFDDGLNAQEKLGDIKGITASTNVVENGYAADAKVVSNIFQNLNAYGNPFVFDYQNGKFGYNTDPERGADSFSTFSHIDNMDSIKIQYSNRLDIWHTFNNADETCNIRVKLKLKENVHYGDKIYFNMGVQYGVTGRNFSYVIQVANINNNEYGYKTNYYGGILTIEFFFPNFAILYLSKEGDDNAATNLGSNTIKFTLFNCDTSFTPDKYKQYNASYDSEIMEVSVLYGNPLKDKIWHGTPKIEACGNFEFDIRTREGDDAGTYFSINKNQIYHNGLGTSSSGSNLIISDGQFYKKSSSSQRYKNSIQNLSTKKSSDPLNPHQLYDLNVISFRYNNDYLLKTDQRYNTDIPGFLAEDIYEKYPIACNLDNEGRPEMWDINILFPAALKLIQEQHEDIEKLKQEIALLKSTNN